MTNPKNAAARKVEEAIEACERAINAIQCDIERYKAGYTTATNLVSTLNYARASIHRAEIKLAANWWKTGKGES